MKRWPQILLLLMALAAVPCLAAPARAGDWMFKPSNYSYSPWRGEPAGPNRFARGPYHTQPYGAVVRSGHRHLRSNIIVGGHSVDRLNVYESWIQFGEQF